MWYTFILLGFLALYIITRPYGKGDPFSLIETKKLDPLPELTPQMRESIAMLPHMPAMEYLLQKLEFQKSALETRLKVGVHKSLTEVASIQAGIAWAGWLQAQIEFCKPLPPKREATDVEADLLRQIQADIQVLTPQG